MAHGRNQPTGKDPRFDTLTLALESGEAKRIRFAARDFYAASDVEAAADAVVALMLSLEDVARTDALFDGIFEASLDDTGLLDRFVATTRGGERWAEAMPSQRKDAERRVWAWCHRGFLRNVGLDDPRTADAVEGHCLRTVDAGDALSLAEQLANVRARLDGPGATATVRAHVIHAQFLLNEQRFDEAFDVIVVATSTADEGCAPEWLGAANRLKGGLELRLGRCNRGLSTLEAERGSGRPSPTPIGLRMTYWTEEEPVLQATEDLRAALQLNDFGASTALHALFRLRHALERADRAKEAAAASRTYEAWLRASAEQSSAAQPELTQLAELLDVDGEHAEANRVRQIGECTTPAVRPVPSAEQYQTVAWCFLHRAATLADVQRALDTYAPLENARFSESTDGLECVGRGFGVRIVRVAQLAALLAEVDRVKKVVGGSASSSRIQELRACSMVLRVSVALDAGIYEGTTYEAAPSADAISQVLPWQAVGASEALNLQLAAWKPITFDRTAGFYPSV